MHAFQVVWALLEERLTMVVNGSIDREPGDVEAHRAGATAIVPGILGEVRRADEKLVSLVQERPVATLCAAAAVGYLIGRVITRLG
jgi:hypothetical protein